MTEAEQNEHSGRSAVIVERLVREQLRAMGCERFDLGIRRVAGEMILREGQGAIEIEGAINGFATKTARARISISGPRGRTV